MSAATIEERSLQLAIEQQKDGPLWNAADAFAPLLGNPKQVGLKEDGPEQVPVNGAIRLAQLTAEQLIAFLPSTPVLEDTLPNRFSRVSIHCSLRMIHHAIQFDITDPKDECIRIYKPTNLPAEKHIADQAVKSLGEFVLAIATAKDRARYGTACPPLPHSPPEEFGADFAAWARYYVWNDRTAVLRRARTATNAARVAVAGEISRPHLVR